MAAYLARVELFGKPSWEDFDRLHAAMGRKGFSKTIKADTGVVYDLPNGTYYRETSADLNTVTDDAKAAATSVWNDAGVLATLTNGIRWNGLRRHDKRLFA